MSHWHEVAHFMLGRGFWYADPVREVRGLERDELFWVPGEGVFCIL